MTYKLFYLILLIASGLYSFSASAQSCQTININEKFNIGNNNLLIKENINEVPNKSQVTRTGPRMFDCPKSGSSSISVYSQAYFDVANLEMSTFGNKKFFKIKEKNGLKVYVHFSLLANGVLNNYDPFKVNSLGRHYIFPIGNQHQTNGHLSSYGVHLRDVELLVVLDQSVSNLAKQAQEIDLTGVELGSVEFIYSPNKPATPSSPLPSPSYTLSTPVLLSGKLTLNLQTCTVSAGDVNNTVSLKPVTVSQLATQSSVGATDFTVRLNNCINIDGLKTYIHFSDAKLDTANADGLLKNYGSARGVAVQLYEQGNSAKPLAIGSKSDLGTAGQTASAIANILEFDSITSSKASKTYTAGYKRIPNEPLSAGTVEAQAHINIFYP